MGEDKVARGHAEHRLSLLVYHVAVGGNFRKNTSCINVRVIDGAVARVVDTGEYLHQREVKYTRRLHAWKFVR